MSKKLIFIFAVFLSFNLFLPKITHAEITALGQTATTTKYLTSSKPPINITSFDTDKKIYNSGDTINTTVTLSGNLAVDQMDVYLDVSFVGGYSKDQGSYNLPQVIYDKKSFGPFTLKANSEIKIPVNYILPAGIGGKDLGLEVQPRTLSGLPLGPWRTAALDEVTGGVALLSIKEAYISIGDGKKYNPESGPTLNATTSMKFHLIVTNPSSKGILVTPSTEIHNRLSSNPVINKYTQTATTIASKSSHEFIIEPYRNDNTPSVYAADVSLVDSNNVSRLPVIEYRYILPGTIATIQSVQFDNGSVNQGDVVHTKIVYSGSTYDIVSKKNNLIGSAVLNEKIYDGQTGELIGEGSATPNFDVGIGSIVLPITISKDAATMRVNITIEKDGKVLANYESSVTTPTERSGDTGGFNPWSLLVMCFILLVLFILYGYIFKISNRNWVLGFVIILVVILISFLYKKSEAQAYLWWQTTDSYTYLDYATFYQPNGNPYLTVGDPVYVQGTVVNWANLSWQAVTVYAGLTYSNAAALTNPQVWTTGVRYAYGTYYDNFNFNLGGVSQPGDYYAQVSVFDNQYNYGYASDRIYMIPFHVYSRVNVSCSPSKTIANVGDTVTWTMSPSGGTGSYKYYWYNSTDQTNWQNSPQTTALSKTYTTPGTKTMSTAIVDNYTGNNSNVNNGGWKQCSNTVTVVTPPAHPLSTSCSVSTTSTSVGQGVIWSLDTTGGVPPYTYSWYENSNALPQKTSSVTRSYAQAGSYNMAYRVDDSNPVIMGPPSFLASSSCPQTVTVTAPLTPDTTIPAPKITGPTSGFVNTDYTYNAVSRYPANAALNKPSQTAQVSKAILAQATPQLKYGFDWNKDGTVDEWQPTSGYKDIGISVSSIHQWTTLGDHPFQVKAMDDGGISSTWTPYSINITSLPEDATSSIRVVHYGASALVPPYSFPGNLPTGFYAQLDSTTVTERTDNPHDYLNLTGGSSHTIYVKDIPGYTESVGTITYPNGGTEQNIDGGAFSSSAISCNGTTCSIPVPTTAGNVTKVGIEYTPNGNTCEFGGTYPDCNCPNGNPPVAGSCTLICTPPKVPDATNTSCVCANGATNETCTLDTLTCTPPQVLDYSGTECVCANGATNADCTLPTDVPDCSTDPSLCGGGGGGSSCTLIDGTVLLDGFGKRFYQAGDTSCTTNYKDFMCKNGTVTPSTPGTYTSPLCNGVNGPIIRPPKNPPAIVTFKTDPDTVNLNERCSLVVDASKSSSCIVTASPATSGGPIKLIAKNSGIVDTTTNSTPITSTTLFTLSCTGKDVNSEGKYPVVTRTARCFINPASFEH